MSDLFDRNDQSSGIKKLLWSKNRNNSIITHFSRNDCILCQEISYSSRWWDFRSRMFSSKTKAALPIKVLHIFNQRELDLASKSDTKKVQVCVIIYLIMTKLDLKTFLKYANQWVGLSADRSKVIASGKTLLDVNEQLMKLKIKDAIVTYILPADQYIAPLCQY